jgi:hypothetical protein
LRNPITGIAGCCAPAASGHVTAAPPSSAMNSNALSKKVENHACAVALHAMHHNFVRIHQTLKITPAMAAGVTDRLWEMGDVATRSKLLRRRVYAPPSALPLVVVRARVVRQFSSQEDRHE